MGDAEDESSKVVCVTDLPSEITEERLRDAFGVFGTIVKLEHFSSEWCTLGPSILFIIALVMR